MKRWLIIVALAACRHDGERNVDPAAGSAQPAPFARGDRRAVEATDQSGYVGVLAPRESTEVTSPFTSKVEKIYVKLGDSVKVGQPLALLDDRPLREELAIAQAAQKEAAIASGAASSKLAMERRAFKAGVASRAAVEAAAYEAGQAGAAVEQHRAKINQLQARLKDTKLNATIGGKVALRYVEEGARVTEGQPVLRVISSSELFVKFAIPGEDARKVKAGDIVEVRFDAKTSGGKAEGVVKTVAPELDAVAQMILAEAEIKDAPKELQSGSVCRIVPRAKR